MTQEDRILIIDDDRDIREWLKEILIDEGFNVFTAENGKEGLSFLLDAVNPRPKLILVDLMMPVMGGAEFVAQKQKQATLQTIPTVIMSANPLSTKALSEFQVQGNILKPFDFEVLLSTIHGYF